MTDHPWETIQRHKGGEPVGIYSICSAHPIVLEAAIAQAAADSSYVLIKASSNQDDQFGEYTGMRPADFCELVFSNSALPAATAAASGCGTTGPNPEIEEAEATLYKKPLPPDAAAPADRAVPAGSIRPRARRELRATPRVLVLDKIRDALRPYADATIPVLRTLSTTASNQGELLV
jgi:tagatose-1,6-bisphosphate aldolase non-catalytic subunit AgaZ/GatZ